LDEDCPFVRLTPEKKASGRATWSKGYDGEGVITSFNIKALGVSITFGLGGVHTEDEAGMFVPQKDEVMLDIDVEAFYPYGIINYKVCPSHLDQVAFMAVYEEKGVKARIYAKSKKKERRYAIRDKGLKIFINNVFGKFIFDGYYLYDPLCGYQVTITNQLNILELAERVHVKANAKIVSINTDGVTVIVKKDDVALFREVYAQWEKDTKFKLEEAQYTMLARLNINNYLAKTIEGKVKCKGAYFNPFITDRKHDDFDMMKGFDAPIVAKALYNWLVNGIDIVETITSHIDSSKEGYSHDNIHDYCIANRVSDDFVNVLRKVNVEVVTHSPKTNKLYKNPKTVIEYVNEMEVQKTMRYYIAYTDVMLYKKRVVSTKGEELEEGEETYTAHQKGWCIMPFNKVRIPKPNEQGLTDWNIDFRWYIEECDKIIKQLKTT
jgi:hypothetical protein